MTRIEDVLSGQKSWGKYALDVLGHTGLGTAYALPPSIMGVWFGWPWWLTLILGTICAMTGGIIREALQYHDSGKPHLLDRRLDALQHILGAPVALGLVLLVQR